MIEFLASFGFISICGGLLYLYLHHEENNEYLKKENAVLKDYSPKCQTFCQNYNKAKHGDLNKAIAKILSEPTERMIAIQNKQAADKQRLEMNIQQKKENQERRKFGYKYDIFIFEIFDINPFMAKDTIISKIIENYQINKQEAQNIFELWNKNNLVTNVYDELITKEETLYEIGSILTDQDYKLVDSDLTRTEWLESKQKLTLFRQRENEIKKMKIEKFLSQPSTHKYDDDSFY